MGRTQAELHAWAARVRDEAEETREQARAVRAASRELRTRYGAARNGRVAAATAPPLDDRCNFAPTVEEAAERALLLELTAREIAEHLGQPSEFIVRAARERAAYRGQPVDDVLREWFRVLLLKPV